MDLNTFSSVTTLLAIALIVLIFYHDISHCLQVLKSWWILGYRLCRRDYRSMTESETSLIANWALAHGFGIGLIVLALFLALE